jgi:mycothiol synthase
MIQAMRVDGRYRWRPLEPGDEPAWAVLLTAIQRADQDWEYLSEEDLTEEFGNPDCDFPRGSTAVLDGSVMAGFGLLTFRDSAGPVHEMRYWAGVDPGHRERGLGGELLTWAERAAVLLHRERHGGRPLTLSTSCLSHNAGAMALYAAHGYQAVRWFHGMERDLSQPVAGMPDPAGVRVVPFTPDRSEAARLIRNESFHDHWGSIESSAEAWAHFIGMKVFRPEFSFLAYEGDASGEPLGVLIAHEYDAYEAATGVRDLYVALVGTRRAGRKRGIASALMARALAGAQAAGFGSASLGVDAGSPTGALGLYERAGFTVLHTSVSHAKPLLEA